MESKCPKNSEGSFPSCICGGGKVYVPEIDECVNVDRTICPHGARKLNQKCVCDDVDDYKYEFDEIFWICRPWYIPTTHAPKQCPTHQSGIHPHCEWDKCSAGYTSENGESFIEILFVWKH